MKWFLTGNPGVGKTTLIRTVAERLVVITCVGFYTEEIRQRGQRTCFSIVTLDGEAGTLASLGTQMPTVGKYSIHVEEFEKLPLPLLNPETMPPGLSLIYA